MLSFAYLLVIDIIMFPFAYMSVIVYNLRHTKTLMFGVIMIFVYPFFATISIIDDFLTNFFKMFQKPVAQTDEIKY